MSKPIDEYKYKVSIHDVDIETNTVILLLEEVDGLDGFSVSISADDLNKMVEEGTLETWLSERVNERKELLKKIEREKEEKESVRKVLSSIEEKLKGLTV